MKRTKITQEVQDEIFRNMSAEKKVKLTSDFSMFLLKLHKLGKLNGFPRAAVKDGKNSQ